MKAIKAFNSDLCATLGKGVMQYEPGKTYRESEAKCARNGFHCAENPLCALGYYSSLDSRFFIVEAGGEVNQDGNGTRISCTEITLLKEITRIQLAALACEYIRKHPDREEKGTHLNRDVGSVNLKGDFIIVRGKEPRGRGVKGSYIFLIEEKRDSLEIESIQALYVDGTKIKADKYYRLRVAQYAKKRIKSIKTHICDTDNEKDCTG